MSKLFEIEDGKVVVTTRTGWRVECLPFGDDLMRAGSALVLPEKPEAPVYYVKGIPEEGEREMPYPYTDESIQDPNTPEEDKQAWAEYVPKRDAYLQEVAKIRERQSLMRSRVMVHRATRIIDPPDLKEWVTEREEQYGIATPYEDERDLLFQFFTGEVARTEDDILRLMAGIMHATGVTEEVLDQFEANFRDSLGGPEGADAQADQEDAPAEAEEEG